MSGQMVPEGLDSASAHTLVIFGGSGDLAARKLVPALYNLRQSNLLPEPLAVVGLGRRELDDQNYRDRLRAAPRLQLPGRRRTVLIPPGCREVKARLGMY